jgi:hypothetical protein
MSFVDAQGTRQSGCERARGELVAQGLMTPSAGNGTADVSEPHG